MKVIALCAFVSVASTSRSVQERGGRRSENDEGRNYAGSRLHRRSQDYDVRFDTIAFFITLRGKAIICYNLYMRLTHSQRNGS